MVFFLALNNKLRYNVFGEIMRRVFFFSFFLVLLDQILKIIFKSNMVLEETIVIIKNFFNITYVLNDGAAWSILSGYTFLLILVAFVALGVIYFFFIKKKNLSKLETITYSFLIGGIIGNLIDRIIYGKVIDYFDFNIFGYDFPVFNIADICICLSVFVLIIDVVKGEINERNNSK